MLQISIVGILIVKFLRNFGKHVSLGARDSPDSYGDTGQAPCFITNAMSPMRERIQ